MAAACQAVTTEFENVPRVRFWPATDRSRPRPRQCRSAGTAPPRRRTSNAPACPARRAGAAGRRPGTAGTGRAAAGHPKTAPGLRRQGPGRGDRRRRPGRLATPAAGPCVLEQRLPLHRELSVIVARGIDGHQQPPVQQNLHRDGIWPSPRCRPPGIDDATAAEAVRGGPATNDGLRRRAVRPSSSCYDGRLVANEMAPAAAHNSNHYSIDACDVSQFRTAGAHAARRRPLVAPRPFASGRSCLIWLATCGSPAAPATRSNPTGRRWPCPACTCTCIGKGRGAAQAQDGPPSP